MSKITLPSSLGSSNLQTSQRVDGGNTVDVQHMLTANPLAQSSGPIAAAAVSVVANVTDAAMVAFQVSGTYAGVNLTFEVSLDANVWHSVLCLRADKSALEATSAVLTANTSRAWVCDVNGFTQFRVRSTAWTSGTANIVIAPSPFPMEMDPYCTLGAGSSTIGNVGLVGKTTGGATPGKLISAATTNATSVKASVGTLYSMHATNNSASWRYLKLYNKASAPTVGTDTPVQVYGLPPSSSIDIGISDGLGLAFATGIALALTGAIADTDTTAIGANEVALSYSYN